MTWKGWEEYVPKRWTPTPGMLDERIVTGERPHRHKYGAVKTTVDGITFDSQKEAKRYAELRLMERAGAIRRLRLQPIFSLDVVNIYAQADNERGRPATDSQRRIGRYVADFTYELREVWLPGEPYETESWKVVVEDVKGFKTPLYRWKKKHVEAQYGITIQET